MRRIAAALAALAVLALAGCTASVSLEPAEDANNPACAPVTVHLPDTVGELPKLFTDAQASGAWGSPVAVILRCGVDVPGPSTLPCFEKNGIQWLRDASKDPHFIFTTFGRDPAVSVAVDADLVSAGVALEELSSAVGYLPLNGRECTSLEDTVTGSTR